MCICVVQCAQILTKGAFAVGELTSIVYSIVFTEEELFTGTIGFRYDNLMMALKPGHPGEILDGILSPIFWDVERGIMPSMDAIRKFAEELDDFSSDFDVKELEVPLERLKQWVADNEQ